MTPSSNEDQKVAEWMESNGFEWPKEDQQWYKLLLHKVGDFYVKFCGQYIYPEVATFFYQQANYTPNAQVERLVLEARIMELRKFMRHEINVFGNCRTKDSIKFDIERLQFKLTQLKEGEQ